MKKITFLFLAFLAFSISASAQFTFPTVVGPTNVAEGSPVTLNINDVANSAGAIAGSYAFFVITVDWTDGFDAYSIEASLTATTTAGDVLFDPPTTGGASNGTATTLTFQGSFTAPYDPSVDGALDITLSNLLEVRMQIGLIL